jgi:hypothetical protein
MSTLSYLKGFCPSNHPDIIRQFLNDYATYSTNKTDLDALLQSDYSDIFALSTYHPHKLKVTTLAPSISRLTSSFMATIAANAQ